MAKNINWHICVVFLSLLICTNCTGGNGNLDELGKVKITEKVIRDFEDSVHDRVIEVPSEDIKVDTVIEEVIVVVPEKSDRERVIEILSKEVGTVEVGGNNRGPGPKKYLKSVGLDEGYAWCAALLHWGYTEAGIEVDFNAWSPSLFTNSTTIYDAHKRVKKGPWQPADSYGIYYTKLKRIGHVGMIVEVHDTYVKGIEGNTKEGTSSRESVTGDGVYYKYVPNYSINKVANVID